MGRTGSTELKNILAARQSALIVWDMQVGIAGRAHNVDNLRDVFPKLLGAARRAGVRVIWTQHQGASLELTSPAMMRILMRRQGVEDAADVKRFLPPDSPEGNWVPWIRPESADVVVAKTTPSLFVGTPVEAWLRAAGLRTVVIGGVATEQGVELTARHALALGFNPFVVPEATGSFSAAAHQVGLDRLEAHIELIGLSELFEIWSE